MGATSVTGVGQGSVEGSNMGSKHWTVGVGRLLGPKVMAADHATLSSGTIVVTLPLLPGVVGDYIVVTGNKTNENAVKAVLTFTSNASVVTIDGTGSDVVAWAIIKAGLSL